MTLDQVLDWFLRGLMVVLTIWVFIWGKTAKQAEALLAAQLQLRDNKLDELMRQIDQAGQKSSDNANRVMNKLNEHGERLAVLDTQLKEVNRRTGETERRQGHHERRSKP